MNFTWGLLVGIMVSTIVCLIWQKMKRPAAAEKEVEKEIVYMGEDEAKKQENLKKIEDYIIDKDKFTNDQTHITGSGFDPALVPETQKVIKELFEMIAEISPVHYKIIDEATD